MEEVRPGEPLLAVGSLTRLGHCRSGYAGTGIYARTAERVDFLILAMRASRALRLLRVLQLRPSLRGLLVLRRASRSPSSPSSPVALHVRALGTRSAWVRPRTTDLTTLTETFSGAYHVPPQAIDPRLVRTIWDLGANVGFTVAHLAQLCPVARIVGVEMDPDNAEMARVNARPWAGRCSIVEAAIWVHDGSVRYHRRDGAEYAFRVSQPGEADAAKPNASASALSLNTLLEREHSGCVDYVKMDIEGAELTVLRENTEWAARVKAINVEVHEPYTVSECVADLTALGFRALVHDRHPSCVVGSR